MSPATPVAPSAGALPVEGVRREAPDVAGVTTSPVAAPPTRAEENLGAEAPNDPIEETAVETPATTPVGGTADAEVGFAAPKNLLPSARRSGGANQWFFPALHGVTRCGGNRGQRGYAGGTCGCGTFRC